MITMLNCSGTLLSVGLSISCVRCSLVRKFTRLLPHVLPLFPCGFSHETSLDATSSLPQILTSQSEISWSKGSQAAPKGPFVHTSTSSGLTFFKDSIYYRLNSIYLRTGMSREVSVDFRRSSQTSRPWLKGTQSTWYQSASCLGEHQFSNSIETLLTGHTVQWWTGISLDAVMEDR